MSNTIDDIDGEEYYDPKPNAPAKATHFGHGAYYKVGVHGRVFVYIEGYWHKSAKTIDEMKRFESV